MRLLYQRYFLIGLLWCFCNGLWSQDTGGEQEFIVLKNKAYIGLDLVIPQAEFNSDFNGWIGGLHGGYWRELNYQPWIFIGVSYSLNIMDGRTEFVETGTGANFVEQEFSATTLWHKLTFCSRYYPLLEGNVNPFIEGHFGPSLVNTSLSYNLENSPDRSDFGLVYQFGVGLTVNLKELVSMDFTVLWNEGTQLTYWQDDDGQILFPTDPFANFERFTSNPNAWVFKVSVVQNF